MEDSWYNQISEQLQTQNELIQNNNDEKTSANNNPPQLEDNNIPQEVIQPSVNVPVQYPPPPQY